MPHPSPADHPILDTLEAQIAAQMRDPAVSLADTAELRQGLLSLQFLRDLSTAMHVHERAARGEASPDEIRAAIDAGKRASQTFDQIAPPAPLPDATGFPENQ